MKNLASYFQPASSQAPSKTQGALLFAMPSMAVTLEQLQRDLPEVAFAGGCLTLESQQIDNDNKQAMIEDIKAQLDQYAGYEERTRHLQVYLMGDQYVAGSNDDDEATLKALVEAALNDPTHTVVALLPEDSTTVKAGDGLSTSDKTVSVQAVDQFLQEAGVTTVESYDKLVELIRQGIPA